MYEPDVTVLPIKRSEFTDGKSVNRLITSWMNNIPCLASPIAPYIEINDELGLKQQFLCSNQKEWEENLKMMLDAHKRQENGDYFYNIVCEHFSVKVITNKWLNTVWRMLNVAGLES